MPTIGDQSVFHALKKALRGDGRLSYTDVQDIILAACDKHIVTVQERDDLRTILGHSTTMGQRSRRALEQFLRHIDRLSAGADRLTRLTGDKGVGVRVPPLDVGPFARRHTDLGKFSHGDFDVDYDPRKGELVVTLKVTFSFEDGISPASHAALKWRLAQGVKAWDSAGAYLESDDLVLNPIILIRFRHLEVARGAHFTVDVEKEKRREWVMCDLNVWEHTDVQTFTHELGHAFGNYDEYRGTGFMAWLERRMYWHDNGHLDDVEALMNGGCQFRARYFDHFERYVNRHFSRLHATYRPRVSR